VSFAFRVFGLPRSGTTWAAAWLSSGRAICWHDPCEHATPAMVEEWAASEDRPAGISCTGLWLHTDWDTDVPTLLLDRPAVAVQRALRRVGLPQLPDWAFDLWEALPYPRTTLQALLTPEGAARAQSLLLPREPFDQRKHAELAKMRIEPSDYELTRVRAAVALTGGLN
jgi:hypothetical protein